MSQGEVHIRPTTPGDEGALASFRCANPGEKWTKTVERLIRNQLSPLVGSGNPEHQTWVAEANGQLVGVISFRDSGQVIEIDLVAVVHEFRRRGIGTKLKRTVMARSAGRPVVSQVHRRNHAMAELNRKLGATDERDPEDGEYRLTTTVAPPSSSENDLTGGRA